MFKKIKALAKPLKDSGFNVEYVWKVGANKITSRIYTKGDVKVGLNYQAEGNSTNYNLTSEFSKKTIITISSMDIVPFLNVSIESSTPKTTKSSDGTFSMSSSMMTMPTEPEDLPINDYSILPNLKIEQE